MAWYAANARDLPWRRTTDAWSVLVSEVMLQQTPVTRVLPIYLEWVARWPTAADLAASSAGDAVRAWGRLGYPRRALRLHEAARVITTSYGGVVPSSVDALLALPGVGAYTARAVASFAYGQRHPVVDTNVRRVLARVVDGVAQAGAPRTTADLAAMTPWLPADPGSAATFGVALMELGALVCAARAPRCGSCPLAADCAWARAGRPAYAGVKTASQSWAGTDRQARGAVLAELRRSPHPVPVAQLAEAWPESQQRGRAVDSLLVDGLVERDGAALRLPS